MATLAEWVSEICGGATEQDLLDRAEKVDDEVPGAYGVMRRVIEGRASTEEANGACFIGLMESKLNKLNEIAKKIDRITEEGGGNLRVIRRLAKVRELLDACLEV